jgi:predicted nuclease of predicted toxin-antitoxin system
MGETPDEAIFALSAERGRMVATLDGDFGTLLATGRAVAPSVILLRGDIPRPAADIARLLGEVLKQVTHSLEQGTVVVVEPGRIRVRVLPVER